MSFVDTLKLVSEYSITIILSAIVIYVVIRAVNLQFDKVQASMKRKEHDDALSLRGQIDEEMYSILTNFLEDHRAYRVHVIEFTNSVMSVSYLPFKYMSCTYEVLEYGAKPVGHTIDKISTSLFSPFLSALGKSPFIELNPNNSDKLTGMSRYTYDEQDCKHCVYVMLKSNKDPDKCIGYVAMYKQRDIETKDTEDMVSLGSKLSAVLGICDK